MKHYEDASALCASASRDTEKDATTICAYRSPGHARHGQWLGVTKWRLVTNAVFNATNGQRWDDEVVPLFKAQGLDADFWSQENLDALLDKCYEARLMMGIKAA